MEGKTITKTVDLGNGFTLIKFDDGEISFAQIITPDGLQEELLELMGEKPKAKITETDTPEDVPEDPDAYTWNDLLELDYKGLRTLCKENNLDTKPKDYEKDEVDEFRKEVAKEIDVKIPDEGGKSEDDDKYTWEDLKEMDFDELEDLIDEEKLDTDPDDYDEKDGEEDKLRKAIGKELGIAPSKPGRKK